MLKKIIIYLMLCLELSSQVFAWDGYDYASSSCVEVEKYNLVREGEDIEIYDYDTHEYKDVYVQSIEGTELEVYDYDSGKTRTFDME
ncbi:MAG: DUF5334 domain-containing protein [Endomicrobium sp.]|uniref:DUF5334 family protein n=1 Tax=Candidatus Endomicrobiellum pyrsonymphae TaxID=1408203 RepID=UPI0035811AC8|nr:DUF5334 domain-containing protein [Endomicrobium sp.]